MSLSFEMPYNDDWFVQQMNEACIIHLSTIHLFHDVCQSLVAASALQMQGIRVITFWFVYIKLNQLQYFL